MEKTADRKGFSPFTCKVSELVTGPGLTIASGSTVGQAAELMTTSGVGSLVIMGQGKPVGIVTKTDMVRRVLAAGGSPDGAVDDIMSTDIISIEGERPVFDALMLMIHNQVGHLLVTNGGGMEAVVSDRDWLTFQRRHPAALFQQIERAGSVEQLAELRGRANGLVRAVFGWEGTAAALTDLVTEINDRTSKRVIELALQAKGPPPAPFAWIAMGSEGRGEQTLSTDQDNGIVFQDVQSGKLEETRNWFLDLAETAVDGLVLCGFPRCKGNVMATNPELCLSETEWERLFAGFIENPEPEALLKASIYFDYRCLMGEAPLVDKLWQKLLARIEGNRGFLRFMGGEGEVFGGVPVNSPAWKLRRLLGMTPPPIDIKKSAVAPIVRCLRALALGCGIGETNTLRRLELAQEQGALPSGLADAVRGAYDFVMLLRIRHHFSQQDKGRPPDNIVRFVDINPLQGRFLVQSLYTIVDLEDFVKDRFGGVRVN